MKKFFCVATAACAISLWHGSCAFGPTPEQLAQERLQNEQRQKVLQAQAAQERASREEKQKESRRRLEVLAKAREDSARLQAQADKAAAQGNARTAVKLYHQTLRLSADQTGAAQWEISKKLVSLAATLDPPIAVPEDAEKAGWRAEALFKAAKTFKEQAQAAEQYRKAILMAPWWPEAYFNLALVYEAMESPLETVESLELYLAAAPRSPDRRSVEKKIVELQVSAEKMGDLSKLDGVWAYKMAGGPMTMGPICDSSGRCHAPPANHVRIEREGRRLRIIYARKTEDGFEDRGEWVTVAVEGGKMSAQRPASVNDQSLRDLARFCPQAVVDSYRGLSDVVKGEIFPGGKRLSLSVTSPHVMMNCAVGDTWTFSYDFTKVEDQP